MTEENKEKIVPETARPHSGSVGEMLRNARTAKNLSIEEVSVALRIRASQLRAIEENNVEALPGMTYAVGFVRSYANYVGLDGVEVVHKFKTEYGQSADKSKLSFPEPVAETRTPDLMVVGIGALLAVAALVGWTVYSNMQGGTHVAEEIQPAPIEMTSDAAPAESLLSPAPTVAAPAVTDVAAPVPMAETAASAEVSATPVTATDTQAAMPSTAAPVVAPDATVAAPAPATVPEAAPAQKTEAEIAAEKAEAKKKEIEKAKAATEAEEVIAIKRGNSRIMLQATQDSWVQVTDAKKKTIYKKVLRPGEKYYVPDEPGLSLVTANAGGLEVYVDGEKSKSLGGSGEIVRGVVLDPSALSAAPKKKAQEYKVNN